MILHLTFRQIENVSITLSGDNFFFFTAGPLVVNKTPPELSVIEVKFTDVKPGGKGSPSNCKPRYKVAIIIPYRDRPQHLQTLLYNLHPMLLKQQIDYQIFIVEQEGTLPLIYINCKLKYEKKILGFNIHL